MRKIPLPLVRREGAMSMQRLSKYHILYLFVYIHTIYGSGSLIVHKKKKVAIKKSFVFFKARKMKQLGCFNFKEMLRFSPFVCVDLRLFLCKIAPICDTQKYIRRG